MVLCILSSISRTLLSSQNVSDYDAGGNGNTNWLPYAKVMLWWLIFILYSTIMFSISWKCKSSFDVFACFSDRSLIFDRCIVLLLSLWVRGYILSSKGIFHPLFRDLLTQDLNLHVCWCLHLVCTNVLRLPSGFVSDSILSLYWLLPSSSSELFDWHWGHTQAVRLHLQWYCACLWYRQSWARVLKHRTSCMRFFVCGQ
jgi:hypothetical protein